MSIIPSNTGGPVSSMVTSLEPGLLRQVEQALRNGRPRTVTECYHHFELERHGISRSAFFRYAARIRQLCDLDEAAERIQPGDLDVSGYLPTLFGRKLLGILLHEPDVDITKLHRLTLAYRAASNTYLAFDDRKKKTPPAGARIPSRTHTEWESLPTNSDQPDDNSTGKDSRHTPYEKGLSPRRLFDTHEQAPNTKTPDPGLPINRSPEVECGPIPANTRNPPRNVLSEISNLKSDRHPMRTDPTARASIHDLLNNRTRRHKKKTNDRAHHHNGIRVEELSDGP